MPSDILIVGAGVFGLTAALSLVERGYRVSIIDVGPVPHPLAASTDISKAVRMEYGDDEQYMAMVEDAIPKWHVWNEMFEEIVYHQVGVTMICKNEMSPGGFEHDSYQMLLERGHTPERLNTSDISRRFPAWREGAFVDGFYHAKGGFARSGRVVEKLLQKVDDAGVAISYEQVVEIEKNEQSVVGARTSRGELISAGRVLIACGAWTPWLVPDLKPMMKATGHPVFHLAPADPVLFQPNNFTVFTADIARSGWYGFPVHPTKHIVKMANHGIGCDIHPQRDERLVGERDEANLRVFLKESFPSLATAPIVYTRRCLYSDTRDEHFLIDKHPEIEGLFVAAGGSGHGFKFAPILGDLIADAFEGKPNRWLSRFAWRSFDINTQGEEAARFHCRHDLE